MIAGMSIGLLAIILCQLFGVGEAVNLSRQEDLELEKQLKPLNKPAIKSIKTQYGELLDCVDFYKQPAFDHPLLKNHSYHFQMKPQFENEKGDDISSNETLNARLPEGGCPVGMVPIRRIMKEELIRERFASEKIIDFGGTKTAGIRAQGKYTGASGFISLYNPPVQENQYSAARIKIQNGNEFIQFGWRVDRALYGDASTHLFVQTNTNSGKCYDTRCGFVVTRGDLSPGFIYPPNAISIRGKSTFETKLRVQRDKDGNWWLTVGNNNAQAGFWPKEIFSPDFATSVEWGGEVSSPHLVSATPMGSGFAPSGNTKEDAYIRWVTGIDINGRDVNVKTDLVINDQENVYKALDRASKDPTFGHMVFFGGIQQSKWDAAICSLLLLFLSCVSYAVWNCST